MSLINFFLLIFLLIFKRMLMKKCTQDLCQEMKLYYVNKKLKNRKRNNS